MSVTSARFRLWILLHPNARSPIDLPFFKAISASFDFARSIAGFAQLKGPVLLVIAFRYL